MDTRLAILLLPLVAAVVADDVLTDLSYRCGSYVRNRSFNSINNTGDDDYPWAALLEYDSGNNKRILCGGALISNRYVLTTAQCASQHNKHWTLSNVIFGAYNINDESDFKRIPVEEVIVHEDYKRKKPSADIALVKLAEIVKKNKVAAPICLPKGPNVGRHLISTGWGKIYGTPGHKFKLFNAFEELDRNLCEEQLPGIKLADDQFCVKVKKNKQNIYKPCIADSGAAIFQSQENKSLKVGPQEGIVGLFNMDAKYCDIEAGPAVYTDVRPYVDWIEHYVSVEFSFPRQNYWDVNL